MAVFGLVMRRMGFDSHFIDMIIHCVTSVQLGSISLGHGLRQGDLLSLYLLIICFEGLSPIMKQAKTRDKLHGCPISRGVHSISHLLFAVNNFFLC